MGAWSLWENANYCWVVICKNKRFHRQTNLLNGHKIPLSETDVVSPAPALKGTFVARCDECGEERSYEPEEVLRVEAKPARAVHATSAFRGELGARYPMSGPDGRTWGIPNGPRRQSCSGVATRAATN